MNPEIIFECIDKAFLSYLQFINGEYVCDQKICTENSITTKYSSYKNSYSSIMYSRKVDIDVIDYYNDNIKIFITIYKLNDKGEGKYKGALNLSDYLKNVLRIDNYNEKLQLSNYEDNSIQEKIESFFKWLKEITDPKLKNIFIGKDWIEFPFDWHGYK